MMGLPQSWRPVSHEQGDTAVHPPVGWALLSTCWPTLDPCPSLCHRGGPPFAWPWDSNCQRRPLWGQPPGEVCEMSQRGRSWGWGGPARKHPLLPRDAAKDTVVLTTKQGPAVSTH